MKINLTQKIKNIYKVAENNPRFTEIVEKHKNGLITKYELSFEYDRIYAEGWRSGFNSLENVRDESKRNKQPYNNRKTKQ